MLNLKKKKKMEKKMNEQFAKAQQQAQDFIKDIPADQVIKNVSFWLDVLINKGRFLDIEEAQKRVKDGVPSSTENT